MNPLFGLRILSLLFSAAIRLATENPVGFLAKVAERIRTSDNPVLSRVSTFPLNWISPNSSVARRMIDSGELSKGIELIDAQGSVASRGDQYLAKRTQERLEQLRVVPPSASSTKFEQGGKHRVLHVLTNSLPHTHSGYTVRSHNVLTSIKNTGIDVHAVTRLAYPVLVGKLPKSPIQTIDGITYERLLPWSYPLSLHDRDELAVEMVVNRARAFGATALHTTTDYKNAVVTSRAANLLGIPWVYEIRGELESTWLSRQPAEHLDEAARSEFYMLARKQEARYAQAASAVVTLSEISKEQFISRGVNEDKIHVIANAIDETIIGRNFNQDDVRRKLGLPNTPLVGSVTSLVDYEGLDTLVKALPQLPSDAKVLIVGEGVSRPRLQTLVASLGLGDRVIFAGRKPQSEIWKWYASLDVFVVPRRDTPVCRTVTPIKALMAQALGVPVVASELPALREVTGELAFYCDPESVDDLADKIKEALRRPSSGRNGIEWAMTRTWTQNGERYLGLYDRLF